MRLLLHIGYNTYLLPKGTNIEAISEAVGGAVVVEEKRGADGGRKYHEVKGHSESISMSFCADDRVTMTEVDWQKNAVDAKAEASKEWQARYDAEQKVAALEKQLATIQETLDRIHNPKPEPEAEGIPTDERDEGQGEE